MFWECVIWRRMNVSCHVHRCSVNMHNTVCNNISSSTAESASLTARTMRLTSAPLNCFSLTASIFSENLIHLHAQHQLSLPARHDLNDCGMLTILLFACVCDAFKTKKQDLRNWSPALCSCHAAQLPAKFWYHPCKAQSTLSKHEDTILASPRETYLIPKHLIHPILYHHQIQRNYVNMFVCL